MTTDPHDRGVISAEEYFRALSYEISVNRHKIVEEHLRVRVRPRPWWLPRWAWKKVMRRLLTIEVS